MPADRLRVALVAPPLLPVPPPAYGGTERVVYALAEGLHVLGHDVTLFASGDSKVSCRLLATVPRACWTGGPPEIDVSFERVLDTVRRHSSHFDLIHSHLDLDGFALARESETPVVSTLHGRLDVPPTSLALRDFDDIPLVAISENQRSFAPAANWVATVLHGIDLAGMPFGPEPGEYLLFVGRITVDKGIREVLEVTRRANARLIIAAKVFERTEHDLFINEVVPALRPGRVDYVGEVSPEVRNPLFTGARATLMLGDWPEPFGLVAIESLATGTPVIARSVGALPEIVRDGIDGFLVDSVDAALPAIREVGRLDRRIIREGAITRFSASRMVADYVAVYRRLLRAHGQAKPAEHAARQRDAQGSTRSR